MFASAPRYRTSRIAHSSTRQAGRSDSMPLAIAHRDGNMSVIDAVREVRRRSRANPQSANSQNLVNRIQGDRYGGEWPADQFRKHGIAYEAASKPKSDLYRDL